MDRQFEVFNNYSRFLLVEGPKLAGKTVAVLHRVARHLWETNGAEVAMFSKIIKTAKNSGVYEELCVNVLPQWFENGYFGGLNSKGEARWVKEGPITTDSVSKTPYFIVRNAHGTTSRLSLFNCADDDEVETRTKNTRFSMIYFPELSNFTNRIVFDATQVQLRCLGLDYDSHQWIADTNPADEGESSWIWKLWFRERFLPPENTDQEQFRNELDSIHFEISDNTKIDPRQVASLRASYEYNPDLFNRYVKGHWTATTVNSHFADLFIENIHVVGDAFGQNKANWEMIVPDENCHEMFSGWDMGSVNHSGTFALKRIVNKQAHFDFIDELVFIKEKISIEDFALRMLEKKHYWEDYCRREYGTKEINWRHWSDDSAWNYRSAANAEDELIVRNVTEGEIMLLKAHKGAGSVELRINLTRKLLFQKRIAISAQLFETIKMMKGLKRGHNKSDIIDPVDVLKHPFDSFSYILIGESPLDAQNRTRPKVERRSSVVTVGV